MTKEQMAVAGYGYHHSSDDGRYQIMGNGTRAFAIRTEPACSKLDNPLRTAEMTLEDEYGMIDGIINNGRRGEELEKAKDAAEKTIPDKKPSIMERLEDAKRECAHHKPLGKAAPNKKPQSEATYEPKQERAAGMVLLPGRKRQAAIQQSLQGLRPRLQAEFPGKRSRLSALSFSSF